MAADAGDMTERRTRPRVLVMHGLESGPGGRKVRLLAREFDARCDQMPVRSLMSPLSGANPWLTAAALVAAAAAVAVVSVVAVIGAGRDSAVVAACVVLAAAAACAFAALRGARFLLDECVRVQEAAIAEFRPDIVAGSSWGGAVCVAVVSRGLWDGPAVIMCPASHKFARIARLPDPGAAFRAALRRQRASSPSGEHSAVLVVHGRADRVVPPADSELLVGDMASERLRLLSVSDGHALSAAAPRPDGIVRWVRSTLEVS